jgi:hypothetical protein
VVTENGDCSRSRKAQRRSAFHATGKVELREQSLIPSRTAIWLGRYASSGIGAYGTDLAFNIENFGHGCCWLCDDHHRLTRGITGSRFRAVEQFNGYPSWPKS